MATIFTETYEAAGYDLSWSESAGTGCSINEDDAGPGTMIAGSTQDLKIILASTGFNAQSTYAHASETATTYTRIYLWWASDGFTTTSHNDVIALAWHNGGDANNFAWKLYMYYVDATTRRLDCLVYWNGTTTGHQYQGTTTLISTTPAWHYVDIKYDATGTEFDWRIDGVQQAGMPITMSGTIRSGIKSWQMGTFWGQYAATYYMDWVKADNATWIGAETGAVSVKISPRAMHYYRQRLGI